MPALNLRGEQMERLSGALRDAFPPQRLREMLKFKLGKRLDDYSLGSDYKEIVFELMTASEAEGWTADLVVAARQSNPGNGALLAFSQEVTLAASTPQLERTIKETSPYLDVELFRSRLGEVEAQVCRIEIPTPRGTIYGTGFLLGPDVIMTNHHVMDSVISGKVAPTTVICRFDYKRLSTATISEGSTFGLAADWLVDQSPPSAVDLKPEPKPGTPNPDELDYALVRLADAAGDKPVGPTPDPNAPKRGWIKAAAGATLEPKAPLLIMQHPDSAPLKLALDMTGVIGANANRTRVTYTVNTEGGSSGAPCFTPDWQLAALHHSGDPNFDPDHKPAYNEGIPLDAILGLLTTRGKLAELG
jgi:hypothetical protein